MTLLDLLSEDVIKVPLSGSTKREVLRELLDTLNEAGKVAEYDQAMDAVLLRESQGSTGLEAGIAVPHAKTDAVADIALALGIHPTGIEFEALDGNPSQLFFMILAPPSQAGKHIEILSEIAKISRSPAFLRSLVRSVTPGEVLELFLED